MGKLQHNARNVTMCILNDVIAFETRAFVDGRACFLVRITWFGMSLAPHMRSQPPHTQYAAGTPCTGRHTVGSVTAGDGLSCVLRGRLPQGATAARPPGWVRVSPVRHSQQPSYAPQRARACSSRSDTGCMKVCAPPAPPCPHATMHHHYCEA